GRSGSICFKTGTAATFEFLCVFEIVCEFCTSLDSFFRVVFQAAYERFCTMKTASIYVCPLLPSTSHYHLIRVYCHAIRVLLSRKSGSHNGPLLRGENRCYN